MEPTSLMETKSVGTSAILITSKEAVLVGVRGSERLPSVYVIRRQTLRTDTSASPADQTKHDVDQERKAQLLLRIRVFGLEHRRFVPPSSTPHFCKREQIVIDAL